MAKAYSRASAQIINPVERVSAFHEASCQYPGNVLKYGCVQIVCTSKEALGLITTKVFRNGNSQAIRIPQELRTTEKEFYIAKVGNAYIAYPSDDPWMPTRQAIGTFSDDFMEERKQPSWDAVMPKEEL